MDMFTYTLRVRECFQTNFFCYSNYPFDQLDFEYRFELSHFEMNDVTGTKRVYRFDHYTDTQKQISWKKNCDQLPEFDMDYASSYTHLISEAKPVKGDKTRKAYYYPGFVFNIKAVRDPMNKMVKSFFPCFLLGLFHLCSF